MSDFLSTGLDGHLERVRTVLAQLRSVPTLADRYASIDAITTLEDLAKVPVMYKDDLQVALAHLQPRAEGATTWVFQSGGSTGSPQIGYAPAGLYMAEVYEHWKALDPDDIFVNGWSAGKMWGAHFLANSYADHARCVAMNVGVVVAAEYAPWFEFFNARRVTAIGGTPSVLRLVFSHARAAGVRLPHLRKVLWLGEAWDQQLDDDLPVVAPDARRWGMFGSTETWVVGTNTPDCTVNVWHPLPSQLVCSGDDEMLDFTCLGPQVLNPVLRYRTGDAGRLVSCPCGGTPAFQVFGRRDGLVKFRGYLMNVDDFVRSVGTLSGVARAQLVIREDDLRSVLDVLVLTDGTATPDLAERVRAHIMATAFGPSVVFQRNPEALAVSIVDTLIGNERTGKISNLVFRKES